MHLRSLKLLPFLLSLTLILFASLASFSSVSGEETATTGFTQGDTSSEQKTDGDKQTKEKLTLSGGCGPMENAPFKTQPGYAIDKAGTPAKEDNAVEYESYLRNVLRPTQSLEDDRVEDWVKGCIQFRLFACSDPNKVDPNTGLNCADTEKFGSCVAKYPGGFSAASNDTDATKQEKAECAQLQSARDKYYKEHPEALGAQNTGGESGTGGDEKTPEEKTDEEKKDETKTDEEKRAETAANAACQGDNPPESCAEKKDKPGADSQVLQNNCAPDDQACQTQFAKDQAAANAKAAAAAAAADDQRPAIPVPQGEAMKDHIIKLAYAEKCSSGTGNGCLAFLETVRNRVLCGQQGSRGCPKTYEQATRWKCDSRGGGYYDCGNGNPKRYDFAARLKGSPTWKKIEDHYNHVFGLDGKAPSNITNGATQNWSGSKNTAIRSYDALSNSFKRIDGEWYYSKTYESRVDISKYKGGVPGQGIPGDADPGGNFTRTWDSNPIVRSMNTGFQNGGFGQGFGGGGFSQNTGGSSGGSAGSGGYSTSRSAGGSGYAVTGGQVNLPLSTMSNVASRLGEAIRNLITQQDDQLDNLVGQFQKTPEQRLQELLLEHQQQIGQFVNALSNNGSQTSVQYRTLLEQQREQLDTYTDDYPDGDGSFVSAMKSLNERHVEQVSELERTQYRSDELIELIDRQLIEHQSAVVSRGEAVASVVAKDVDTSVPSDLTVTALKANQTLNKDYRFQGTVRRTLTGNDTLDLDSYFGSNVVHELLIDYSCDGTIDARKTFQTPYYSVVQRTDGADILLSEYAEIPESSSNLHCFAFDTDTTDVIPESNEDNNRSNWREFIAGFGASGGGATSLPPLNFEVSVYSNDYSNITQNWTDEDVIVSPGQQIAFRWDAPQYEQCVPLLSSLTSDITSNLSPVRRNTLSEQIELHEHTGYYEIRCTVNDDTRIEVIHVTVTDDPDGTKAIQQQNADNNSPALQEPSVGNPVPPSNPIPSPGAGDNTVYPDGYGDPSVVEDGEAQQNPLTPYDNGQGGQTASGGDPAATKPTDVKLGNGTGSLCKGSKSTSGVSAKTLAVLQYVGSHVDHCLFVSSAYRDDAHNRKVGGASKSQHTQKPGRAIDLSLSGLSETQKVRLVQVILSHPDVKGFGYYPKGNHSLHFDTRPARTGAGYWSNNYKSDSFDSNYRRGYISPLIAGPVYQWSRTGRALPLPAGL